MDENSDDCLTQRIQNLINQMRTDNKGVTQPLRIYFLNEKQVTKEEVATMLCEDHYKDESFYVDFLADVHQNIQNKMN